MKRDRVVLDTNVLISGALSSTSTPALALEMAVSDGQLLASTATLRELMEKLLAAKFDPYVSREKRDALLLRLAPLIEIVEVIQTIQASRDPKDDKFLEVAVNGCADVLVTGDGDLLELHPFRGIAILTPADYVSRQTSSRAASPG
jgi:putative PIN family toxin of toxin-antitoxin system